MSIFKRMHQIWFQGKNNIPDKFKYNIYLNTTIQTDWEYILWDDKLITKLMLSSAMLTKTYNELIYMHQKVDFAKYVILYYYGGIYIDMDAYSMKNLDMLINENIAYDLIVSKLKCNMFENYVHCSRDFCINNGIIYATPYNNILLKMIQYVINHHKCSKFTVKILCIEQTTGPKKFTDIIMENLDDKIKILEPEYFEPCILDICNITNNTYIAHVHNGSWYSDNLKSIFLLYLNNKLIVYVVFFIFIISIIYWKKK